MRRSRCILLTLFLLLSFCARGESDERREMSAEAFVAERAHQMAQEVMIVDTHIDLPYRLTTKKMEDISRRTDLGEFDYPRAKAGGLDAAFMAVYVPAEYQEKGGAKEVADGLIDLVESLENKWPDKFSIARSSSELQANFEKGLFSLPMGIENGAAIEDELGNLEYFYERGVRYITLVHGTSNQLCDSSYDSNRKWKGLSPLGRETVVEMNRLGIMVDVSHVSDESFYDVIEVSKAPVIASHSSCRYFTPGWERNMDDRMIRLLAENGGIIQINFGSMFLTQDYREAGKRVEEFLDEKGIEWDSPEATELIAEFRERVPAPEVTVSDVADHIDHVVALAGIDHVGLGSDFDGVGGELPVGLEDVSCYPNLILELLKRDYTAEDIRKICSANLVRVWTEVEKKAIELN